MIIHRLLLFLASAEGQEPVAREDIVAFTPTPQTLIDRACYESLTHTFIITVQPTRPSWVCGTFNRVSLGARAYLRLGEEATQLTHHYEFIFINSHNIMNL